MSSNIFYGWGQEPKLIDPESGGIDNQPAIQGVPTSIEWAALKVGYECIFGLSTDGRLYARGYNGDLGIIGLGLANYAVIAEFTELLPGTTWIDFDVAYNNACAVRADGALFTWGYGVGGLQANSNVPVQFDTGGVAVRFARINDKNLFYITASGALYGYGNNDYYQIGQGNYSTSFTGPINIAPGVTFSSISFDKSSSRLHYGATAENGDLYFWGKGSSGQLGDGTSTDIVIAFHLAGKKWRTCSCGDGSTLAIDDAGDLYFWGSGLYGEIGLFDGVTANYPYSEVTPIYGSLTRATPTKVGEKKWSEVVNTGGDCIAIDTDGVVYGWGQIGDDDVSTISGLKKFIYYPMELSVPSPVSNISIFGDPYTATAVVLSGAIPPFWTNFAGQSEIL